MTPLALLNFVVLQWFGVRLCAAFDQRAAIVVRGSVEGPARGRWWSSFAPPRGVRVQWSLLRWVFPLTGWWSDYRWIARSG